MRHGDRAVMECEKELYDGTIERRILGQWPYKEEAFFFVRPLYLPYRINSKMETDLGRVTVLC